MKNVVVAVGEQYVVLIQGNYFRPFFSATAAAAAAAFPQELLEAAKNLGLFFGRFFDSQFWSVFALFCVILRYFAIIWRHFELFRIILR